MSRRTVRTFDEPWLTPEVIRELRLRENPSQTVVAQYLDVTAGQGADGGEERG